METPKTPFFVMRCLGVKNHFQELIRLLSILIAHLSTDYLRTDPWVQKQCTDICSRLEIIKRTLLQQPLAMPTDEQDLNEIEPIEAQQFVQELFTQINNIIDMIDDETKEIVLTYESYHFDFVRKTS